LPAGNFQEQDFSLVGMTQLLGQVIPTSLGPTTSNAEGQHQPFHAQWGTFDRHSDLRVFHSYHAELQISESVHLEVGLKLLTHQAAADIEAVGYKYLLGTVIQLAHEHTKAADAIARRWGGAGGIMSIVVVPSHTERARWGEFQGKEKHDRYDG